MITWSKYLERICREKVRGRTYGRRRHTRRYYNFASVIFHTLLDRYSKITVGSRDSMCDLVECFDAFVLKFCRDFTLPEYASLPELIIPEHPLAREFINLCSPNVLALLRYMQSTIDVNVLNFHYFEYMKALQEKNLPSDRYQNDLDEFSLFIDFFSKRQCKADIRNYFEERLKAGQGVSAFQKHINALLAPYSRCMADLLHRILLPNVILASNVSDSVIGARIGEFLNEFPGHYQIDNFACDFAEYDSSQYELSPMANSIMMLFMRAPPLLVDLYIHMRHHWCLSDDMVKLYGFDKMHSGEPFTLIGNTFFGMLVIAHAVDFDDLLYAAFKGDDSALAGHNVRFNARALQWCLDRGLSLKDEYPPFMEFTGMFITPYGFFPDVVRKSVKFLSTIYRDDKHFAEAKRSVAADLCCITSHAHFVYGCNAAAAYYNFVNKTNKIGPEDVACLCSFLHTTASLTFAELQIVDAEVFHVFHSDFPVVPANSIH